MNLLVQCFDHVRRALNRSPELAPFPLPAADAFVLGTAASLLDVDPVANLALLVDCNGGHDEFHTAGFTRAVFPVAMLSEVAPFPVTTGETVLVEEAHV